MGICAIIDLDGFHTVEYKFLVREFGFIGIREDEHPRSYHYDLTPFWKNLGEKSLKTVHYCVENVHGLSFCHDENEIVKPYDELENDILHFYSDYKCSINSIVGYKGGNVERDILQKLKIPCVNLEIFGVSKFNILNANGQYNGFSCGIHKQNLHCPRAEIKAFRDYYLNL